MNSKKENKIKSIKFIEVFSKLLKCNQHQDVIKWDDDGKKIQIIDKQLLSTTVLPIYFKHGNYSSFLRQLNIYGFTSCKDSDGLLTYTHPYFTRNKISIKNIHKKQQSYCKQLNFDSTKQEYEEQRNTIISLQQEQAKIQNQLLRSIQQQLQCQAHLKMIIQKILHIKDIQEKRASYFIGGVRMIVKALKKEPQSSFQYLIKCVFPQEEQMLLNEGSSMNDSEDADSFLLATPAPFGKEVVEDIGNYLNHLSQEFNAENLEPVWYFGQQETDFNFFGFEL